MTTYDDVSGENYLVMNIPEMKSKDLNMTGASFNHASSGTPLDNPDNDNQDLVYPTFSKNNGRFGKRKTVAKNASAFVSRKADPVKIVKTYKKDAGTGHHHDVSTGIVHATPISGGSKEVVNYGNTQISKDDD